MRVLTRRAGERLLFTVGRHRFTIEILASSNGRTRIGIDAPRNIKVIREELHQTASAVVAEGDTVLQSKPR